MLTEEDSDGEAQLIIVTVGIYCSVNGLKSVQLKQRCNLSIDFFNQTGTF